MKYKNNNKKKMFFIVLLIFSLSIATIALAGDSCSSPPADAANNNITNSDIDLKNHKLINATDIQTTDVHATNDVVAGNDMTATNNVTAGNDMTATHDVTAGNDMTAINDVTAGNDISATNNVTAGNDMAATHDIVAGNDIAATNDITANDITAANVVKGADVQMTNDSPATDKSVITKKYYDENPPVVPLKINVKDGDTIAGLPICSSTQHRVVTIPDKLTIMASQAFRDTVGLDKSKFITGLNVNKYTIDRINPRAYIPNVDKSNLIDVNVIVSDSGDVSIFWTMYWVGVMPPDTGETGFGIWNKRAVPFETEDHSIHPVSDIPAIEIIVSCESD